MSEEKEGSVTYFECDIEQRFRTEIKQNLKNIPESRFKESQELMKDFLEKNQTIDYREIFRIDCNYREMTLIKAALYLLEYEGKFGFCVNLTYFLFVANDPKKQGLSFEDIEKKRISKKCKFLATQGFKTFDEKNLDNPLKKLRDLRNMIAHFNFIISEDGEFRTFNRDVTKREIMGILPEHGKLLDYTNIMIPALRNFTKVW